jgi:dihydrofolate synthase/folylpolyglutamate synthase
MAFLHFRDRKVEVAVLEVGMGGRLDATNAVDPVTALFTPIDLDHREHLGDTLDAIAREKAGILKPGGRAITAPQAPEALVVLRRAASVRGATLLELDQIWRIGEGAEGSLDLVPRSETGIRLEGIRLPLAGRHQRVNAALAAAAATRLPDFRARIGAEAIRKGLSEARWPGRCELVASDPDVLLDGAHNPAGARALRHHLVETYTSKGRQVVLVFGAMADKDLSAMMESLLPCAKRVFLTRAETPRAADPMALEAIARLYHPSVVRAPSLSAALFAAREEAGPAGVVCVTGSLYLVGDALALHEGIEPRVRMAL